MLCCISDWLNRNGGVTEMESVCKRRRLVIVCYLIDCCENELLHVDKVHGHLCRSSVFHNGKW